MAHYASMILSIIVLILDWSIIEHKDKFLEHTDFTTNRKVLGIVKFKHHSNLDIVL